MMFLASFFIAGIFTVVRKKPTCLELFNKYSYAEAWLIDWSDYAA